MAKAKRKSNTRALRALTRLPVALNPEVVETADRALPVHRYVPAGCLGYLVDDERTQPHLRPGEFAIIDQTDRKPIAGELYLIRFDHPLYDGGMKKIIQVIRKTNGIMGSETHPFWVGPYIEDQHVPGIGMMRMIDGPYSEEHLAEKLIGRVVGVMEPANTKRLDREVMW